MDFVSFTGKKCHTDLCITVSEHHKVKLSFRLLADVNDIKIVKQNRKCGENVFISEDIVHLRWEQ